MSHLEEDWSNPTWAHYINNLARDFNVIRYDQRGNGMSDWNDVDIVITPTGSLGWSDLKMRNLTWINDPAAEQ